MRDIYTEVHVVLLQKLKLLVKIEMNDGDYSTAILTIYESINVVTYSELRKWSVKEVRLRAKCSLTIVDFEDISLSLLNRPDKKKVFYPCFN